MSTYPIATGTSYTPATARLSKRLRAGMVVRREDLTDKSGAVDRHLRQLQDSGRLQKISRGIYYVPKMSTYGKLPPNDRELVAAFLRDSDFLMFSPSSYNKLGLGTTQLYNKTMVYNHKRHGTFSFNNRTFDFRMRPRFPHKLTAEFLFVDLLNNLSELPEERDQVLSRAAQRARQFNPPRLRLALSRYGNMSTKKLVNGWLNG